MNPQVPLEEIPSCFEGIVPAAIATVAEDGTPNVTYISVVHRVDERHVALSRQFFNKTDHNTVVNPRVEVTLIEPETGRMFLLDLVHIRTETEGPLFERMRTKLDAVAAAEGMTNIFRLKGTDICEVTSCVLLACQAEESAPRRDMKLERVMQFSSALAGADDMDELFETALRACTELLEHPHTFIMLADESGERLYTVASTGFETPGTGSEVKLGEGLIGLAAARRQSVRVTNMGREISYSRASAGGDSGRSSANEIPLPTLPRIQSQLVTPMLAQHQLVGMICLQSEEAGRFRAADEWVVAILANQVAVALGGLSAAEAGRPAEEACEPLHTAQVKHYADDDSVFIDNEYLIKGVAGGILWRLLRSYRDEGRTDFSNKEIRLDRTLDLPDIKDNLEARLILLRKRLEERCGWLRIEKSGRGRFRLAVERPLELVQVDAGAPVGQAADSLS